MDMDSIAADIRADKSVKLLAEFKNRILETAKNIKSNDSTFETQTLDQVSGDLIRLMDSYSSMVQKVRATERTFEKLRNDLESNERQEIDATGFRDSFNATYSEFLNSSTPSDEAQAQLNAIIRQAPAQNQDEEIVVEAPAEKVWPKDPITKMPIQKAVRNKVCKHLYDRTSFENYIEQRKTNKQRVACPVAGCQNKNTSSKDLIPDDETNNLIESMRG